MKPSRNDSLLAVAVMFLAALEVLVNPGVAPKWAAAVTEMPFALALAWRGRLPVLVVALVSVGLGLEAALGVPPNEPVVPLLTVVIAVFSVSVSQPLRRSLIGAAVILPGIAVGVFHISGDAEVKLGNFAFAAIILGGVWVAGRLVRLRTREASRLAREGERLEAERLVAVSEERARIARELHDVIAHSVSVMVIQAEAAQEVLKQAPHLVVAPLGAIQETGRQAMVEMSRLVGLLREDGQELGLAPQPGLSELHTLRCEVGRAGLPVSLRIEGEPRQIPIGVDLAAYRILQEALTNTIKHAGPAHAEVTIRYGPDSLELEVIDDGSGTGNGHVGGHGLVGMRERVSVFGGELDAGARPERGYAVRARLPLALQP
ncbi:MAG TPA: histidine kinase [Solirubrobacteraceae bacterium]|nr:histidine kinase [Solirubrobacteraceae bacterium]